MKIKDGFLVKILDDLINIGASPILVGGCVRDFFLNVDVKDYDVEVYGLDSLEELENILKNFGKVKLVGKSFGILKLSAQEMEYDFSFPRMENKIADGHKGFEVLIDGNLSFKDATRRRDFTINSIGYDYKNKIYLDPFNGRKDLEKKVLKHIDDVTFIEDPLRVYRLIQFRSRLNFTLNAHTFKLCQQIVKTNEFHSLSKERIYVEYKKLLLKSSEPSFGLNLLNKFKIEKISEDKLAIIDEIAQLRIDNEDKLILVFSVMKDIFIKISNNKKLLRKIENYETFRIPKNDIETYNKVESKGKKMLVKLDIQKNIPKPIYSGKDLIEMGYTPNEKFKTILDTLHKMQLDGKIC